MPDAITKAIQGITARTIARRFGLENKRMAKMDRLTEKLTKASGVVARLTRKMETKADELIARESLIDKRTERAFAPHHAMLDTHLKDLDRLEDGLKLVENADPLQDYGREDDDPPGHHESV
jgi:hypothetical protein